jgi:hypothetical protein
VSDFRLPQKKFSITCGSTSIRCSPSPRAKTTALIEVLIDLKNSTVPVHTYVLPIHARDLDHPQFAWHLQRQLYDGLHDYFIEMFTRTPQDHSVGRPMKADRKPRQGKRERTSSAVSSANKSSRRFAGSGPIPFSRYMQICLYDPVLGYYSAQRRTIRQSRRLLYFERRSRRLRTPAGAAVRRNMASAGSSPANRNPRTRPRTRLVRPRCARLVQQEIPRLLAALTYTLQESSPRCARSCRKSSRAH